MFFSLDKYVLGMAILRILSSMIEFSAALLMLKINQVESALKVNAALALVGPTIMMAVMALGLFGLAGKIQLQKMIYIVLGVGLIFYGLNK
ncbi:MAG TPA: YqhV family protein [Clostridia bacterium]|nr:YqhV family protein [Clostridia bacterium]